MAEAPRLLLESRTGSTDGTVATARDVWHVYDSTPETALLVPGVPYDGQAMEWNGTTVKADRLTVERTPNPTVQRVIVDYSNDNRFSFDPQPTNTDGDTDAREIELSYQRAELKVPAFRKTRLSITTDGQNQTRSAWVRDDLVVNDYFRPTLRIAMTRDRFTAADRREIRRQVNFIHIFNTNDYGNGLTEFWRLLGCRVTSSKPGKWRYAYEWVGDPGNDRFMEQPPNDGNDWNTDYLLPYVDRDAFQSYIIVAAPFNPFSDAPGFKTVQTNIVDFNRTSAWRNLPGDPLAQF